MSCTARRDCVYEIAESARNTYGCVRECTSEIKSLNKMSNGKLEVCALRKDYILYLLNLILTLLIIYRNLNYFFIYIIYSILLFYFVLKYLRNALRIFRDVFCYNMMHIEKWLSSIK